MSNKPYLFVSYKSWKKTEREIIKSFVRQGKNSAMVAEPVQAISLTGVGKPSHHYVTLRNQLEVKSACEFPLSMSKYQVSIVGRKEKDPKRFVYDLTVSDGSREVARRHYRCKKQWSFLGVQSFIKQAEDRSNGQDEQKMIENLSEPTLDDFQIKLTYKNGILRFEDPLGEGVWGSKNFAFGSDLLLDTIVASKKFEVSYIFEEVCRLIDFAEAQKDHTGLDQLVDKDHLNERLALISTFLQECAVPKANTSMRQSSEPPKISDGLLTNADTFLRALTNKNSDKSDFDKIKRFYTDSKGLPVSQFCSIEVFKRKDIDSNKSLENMTQDAKADGYIWRLSHIFNEEISKLCDAFINSVISKRCIKINDPFFDSGNIMFDLLLSHDIDEHNVQLLRQSISLEGSSVCIVIREKRSESILLWQKLTTSMPPQCSFGIIDDNLFYLHSDSSDPARTFETKSINLTNLISEAFKKDVYSVVSINNEITSWDQNSSATIGMATYKDTLVTINYQYDFFIWTDLHKQEIIRKEKPAKTTQYKFSKDHPPTECMAFIHIFNPTLILVVFFKEFAFKTFLISPKAEQKEKTSFEVLDKYETLFDAAVDNEDGASRANKQSTFNQNCPYPFHYPIIIKRAIGHLLILPYKLLDFELLFISENVRLLHLATKAKVPKLLFTRIFPEVYTRDSKDGKPFYTPIDASKKLYESYFSADSTDSSRINIVVVKKQKDKSLESIRVIRCMLKL